MRNLENRLANLLANNVMHKFTITENMNLGYFLQTVIAEDERIVDGAEISHTMTVMHFMKYGLYINYNEAYCDQETFNEIIEIFQDMSLLLTVADKGERKRLDDLLAQLYSSIDMGNAIAESVPPSGALGHALNLSVYKIPRLTINGNNVNKVYLDGVLITDTLYASSMLVYQINTLIACMRDDKTFTIDDIDVNDYEVTIASKITQLTKTLGALLESNTLMGGYSIKEYIDNYVMNNEALNKHLRLSVMLETMYVFDGLNCKLDLVSRRYKTDIINGIVSTINNILKIIDPGSVTPYTTLEFPIGKVHTFPSVKTEPNRDYDLLGRAMKSDSLFRINKPILMKHPVQPKPVNTSIQHDCGTKNTQTVFITMENAKHYKNRTIIVDGKLVIMSNPADYIGHTVELRTVLFCESNGYTYPYCEVCTGFIRKELKHMTPAPVPDHLVGDSSRCVTNTNPEHTPMLVRTRRTNKEYAVNLSKDSLHTRKEFKEKRMNEIKTVLNNMNAELIFIDGGIGLEHTVFTGNILDILNGIHTLDFKLIDNEIVSIKSLNNSYYKIAVLNIETVEYFKAFKALSAVKGIVLTTKDNKVSSLLTALVTDNDCEDNTVYLNPRMNRMIIAENEYGIAVGGNVLEELKYLIRKYGSGVKAKPTHEPKQPTIASDWKKHIPIGESYKLNNYLDSNSVSVTPFTTSYLRDVIEGKPIEFAKLRAGTNARITDELSYQSVPSIIVTLEVMLIIINGIPNDGIRETLRIALKNYYDNVNIIERIGKCVN